MYKRQVLRRCQNLFHSLPITPDPRAPHRAMSRNDLLYGPGRPEYIHYITPDDNKSKISQRWELMLKVQALFTSILYEKYAQKLILPYHDRKDCKQIFSKSDICMVPDLVKTGSDGQVPRHGICSIVELSLIHI